MNALRSTPRARASRRASAAVLLVVLALFAGSLRSLAFTPADLAGTWEFQFNYPGLAGFTNVLELKADGTVDYQGAPAGTFTVSGTAFAADFSDTGGALLNGTVSSNGNSISGNADLAPFFGTFTATRVGGGIVVELADGTKLVSGTSTVDFGNGSTGAEKTVIAKVKFIIKNTGNSPLIISDAAVSSGPFRVTGKPGKKVAAGGKASTSVTLQMTPNDPLRLDGNPPAPTLQEGKLLIYSDDPGTPIFRIKLTGQSGGFSPQTP